jgi:hypothetical protein
MDQKKSSDDSDNSEVAHIPQHVHEHMPPFFTGPIVDSHVLPTIRTALSAAVGLYARQFDRYEQSLSELEARLRSLDWLARLARRAVYGDAAAQELLHAWLGSREDQRLGKTTERSHDVFEGHEQAADHAMSSAASAYLTEAPIFNLDPIADLFIAAAFGTGADAHARRQQLETIRDLTERTLPFLDLLHDAARKQLRGLEVPETLINLLQEFQQGKDLSRWPGAGTPAVPGSARGPRGPSTAAFQTCRDMLLEVVDSSQSAQQLWLAAVADVHDLTSRIAGISPQAVCAGAVLTIRADGANPFSPTQPAGYGVFFEWCGVPGNIESWDPAGTEVKVRVPESASSGCVWFGRVPSNQEVELINLQSNRASDLLVRSCVGGFLRLRKQPFSPSSFCQPRICLPNRTNHVDVWHKPVVTWFLALDSKGGIIQAPVEACSTVLLDWSVTSDHPITPAVTITSTSLRRTGLPAFGSLQVVVGPGPVETFTLEATNVCGSVRSKMQIEVIRRLQLSPIDVNLSPGEAKTLTIRTSCPVDADTNITLTPDVAGKATINPAVMTIVKGQDTASVTVGTARKPGDANYEIYLATLEPNKPAVTVTAKANGYQSASANVWIENPLGTWTHDEIGLRHRLSLVAIHGALLRSGKVLFFSLDVNDYNNIEKGQAVLWDPTTERSTQVPWPKPRNLFCAGHCFLPDGRLLVAGGHAFPGLGRGADWDVHTFDPIQEEWTQHLPMAAARWYPTCTTLPNGKALIVSGSSGGAPWEVGRTNVNPVMTLNEDFEIFDPATARLTTPKHFLSGISWYPFVHVLPGGTLFVHTENTTFLFSLDPTTGEPVIPALAPVYRTRSINIRTYGLLGGQGACVILPFLPGDSSVRVLIVGGGDETKSTIDPNTLATDTAEIFTFNPLLGSLTGQVGWSKETKMFNRRFMSDAILLPDGSVLVTGGAGKGEAPRNSNPVMEAELFDQETETWRPMAKMEIERRYHSVALLLPDGRVLTAGSTRGWPPQPARPNQPSGVEYRLELFSPPYLYRGPRPVIAWAPHEVQYGMDFDIGTDDALGVDSVAFIRSSSVTHSLNTDQRYVGLAIKNRSAGRLTATAPRDSTIAPPGYYLLFLVRGKSLPERIPSVGEFVRLR